MNAGLYDQAIEELAEAAHACPEGDELPWYVPANSPGSLANPPGGETVDQLRRAIAENPESADLHFRLGTLLAREGLIEEAELRFTQVLSINRDHVDAMVCLALCHRQRGDFSLAVSLLRKAQSLRPGDPGLALLLARAAKRQHDTGAAIDLYAVVTND